MRELDVLTAFKGKLSLSLANKLTYHPIQDYSSKTRT